MSVRKRVPDPCIAQPTHTHKGSQLARPKTATQQLPPDFVSAVTHARTPTHKPKPVSTGPSPCSARTEVHKHEEHEDDHGTGHAHATVAAEEHVLNRGLPRRSDSPSPSLNPSCQVNTKPTDKPHRRGSMGLLCWTHEILYAHNRWWWRPQGHKGDCGCRKPAEKRTSCNGSLPRRLSAIRRLKPRVTL